MEQRINTKLNILSYIPVRRNNWILQVSLFKRTQVLVVYKHVYDIDRCGIKHYDNLDKAVEFIENIILED